MDRPLIIANVHNLSLESYSTKKQPQLVAQFPCDCELTSFAHATLGIDGESVTVCPAVGLYDMYNVTLKGINITVQAPEVSGLVIRNVSNVFIQMISTHNALYQPTPIGIIILRSYAVYVLSLNAYRFQYGVAVLDTNNIFVYNLSAIGNERIGLFLHSSKHSVIAHATISHNKGGGMNITNVTNTQISNLIVEHNRRNGMFLGSMNQTHISNTNVLDNWGDGMYLEHMIDTQITNSTISGNGGNGLSLRVMNNTHIIDTTTTHNWETGMYLEHMIDTQITNCTVSLNGGCGLSE